MKNYDLKTKDSYSFNRLADRLCLIDLVFYDLVRKKNLRQVVLLILIGREKRAK